MKEETIYLYTFVYMPYRAMDDLFDKSVMYNEGIGDVNDYHITREGSQSRR
jgi:hypothetical protein